MKSQLSKYFTQSIVYATKIRQYVSFITTNATDVGIDWRSSVSVNLPKTGNMPPHASRKASVGTPLFGRSLMSVKLKQTKKTSLKQLKTIGKYSNSVCARVCMYLCVHGVCVHGCVFVYECVHARVYTCTCKESKRTYKRKFLHNEISSYNSQ